MASVLVLAPSENQIRSRSEGLEEQPGWFGALFEEALIEVVQTLDGPGAIKQLILPWRPDLAPLIAAAATETAIAFDPEGRSAPELRTRIIAYLEPDSSADPGPFWRSSHLSLSGTAPRPLTDLGSVKPTHIIALGVPSYAGLLHALFDMGAVPVYFFGSLADPAQISAGLDIPPSKLRDMEEGFKPDFDALDRSELRERGLERLDEAELEPFVPFGLLLQSALDELLEEDRRPDSKRL